MPTKNSAPRSRVQYRDVRVRFRVEEMEEIRLAAANRGLGFQAFVRQVSAGTARLVLEGPSSEALVGRFLDADSVLTRGPAPVPPD